MGSSTIKNIRQSNIDGIRFLAIISIVLFHYFSRYVDGVEESALRLPYGNDLDYFPYGGVIGNNMFFLLSGFFIYPSLRASDSIARFFKKKIIRLFPPLLVASILTVSLFLLFDKEIILPGCHSVGNFCVSLTMISPKLVNWCFGTHLSYLNGSYWFLWVIVEFYFIAGLLYYVKKEYFFRNYTILTMACFAITIVSSFLGYIHLYNEYYTFVELFPFMSNFFVLWVGVFLYQLFNHQLNKQIVVINGLFCVLMMLYFANWYIFAVICFFILVLKFPRMFSLLQWKPICVIGQSSFFLYLIHEPIGVMAIYYSGYTYGTHAWIVALVMLVLFMVLSVLYSRFIDTRITYILNKTRFINKK